MLAALALVAAAPACVTLPPEFPAPGFSAPVLLDTPFVAALEQRGLCVAPADAIGVRIVSDFGAVFLVEGATRPATYALSGEDETARFQGTLQIEHAVVSGVPVTLQAAALRALQAVLAEGVQVTPASPEASVRNYRKTADLWRGRVENGLRHWVKEGRLTPAEGEALRALPPREQVPRVLTLESKGIYFSQDLSKSILYSVAAPGTSQHLSLLAMDVREHGDERVRTALARHGWYQTVFSDLPHFTYLGVPASRLAERGLVARHNAGRTFWIPAAEKRPGASLLGPNQHQAPDVTEDCPF